MTDILPSPHSAQTPLQVLNSSIIDKSSPSQITKKDDSSILHTPKYESFVMTGDKILKLNSNRTPAFSKSGISRIPRKDKQQGLPGRQISAPVFSKTNDKEQENNYLNNSDVGTYMSTVNDKILEDSNQENLVHDNMKHDKVTNNTLNKDEQIIVSMDKKINEEDISISECITAPVISTIVDNSTNNRGPFDEKTKYPSFIIPRSDLIDYDSPSHDNNSTDVRSHSSYTFNRTDSQKLGSTQSEPFSTMTVGDIINEKDYDRGQIREKALNLYNLNGYNGKEVMNEILKLDNQHAKTTHEFLNLFYLTGVRIDAALREFLKHVTLHGEPTAVSDVIMLFASRYFITNPTLYKNVDDVHYLICALLLLNTDLHNPNITNKMSCREFINNVTHQKNDYDRNLLKVLYSSISKEPLSNNTSLENVKKVNDDKLLKRQSSFRKSLLRKKSERIALIMPQKEQVDYKHGFIYRKCLFDSEEKKTPFGRRKWELLYGTVKGLTLYLHKDEDGFKKNNCEVFKNCILLHHSIAEVANDYKKKNNVFRIKTARGGEYLLQTTSVDEMSSWINAINYVAAAFSAPTMPAPVSSLSAPFQKPKMPDIVTTYSIPEQLKLHKEKVREMSDCVSRIRQDAPSTRAKKSDVIKYFYKERYFENERQRYATYATILEEKLSTLQSSDLLSVGSRRNLNSVIRQSFPTTSSIIPLDTTSHSTTYMPSTNNIQAESLTSKQSVYQ
ncbi:Sec7 domain and Pleckstrin homology domain, spectrin-type and Pleckstrin homology domain and Pleckstrin homology-like domain and Sec7 domain, alpha orthogonal bundle-containing protein [Strongyloides ratti]|uniref:Sec7 domain and Pleckstrin homology domain, spectrin-type and Pleckstrin homology domain and Pleckstrin homology-like domain and Sec7 domain, alpha orthogonal bundle-containing protein n=1 Tax=Strongyloides ratti TaxID=34506 RepID=A0A090KTC7_STRRB|nr:Sec7 domain and Pleckstrin homology domain, spectrin-type and Pleckstrin homology domain and Pleckstrin homology-like domain and Sec7 domain, alpha orthogonal bundle-containing protein [Strongyloides ratti]CEF60735.1 Sec7 domain and Pleckstrin homology domain, spectrin-type and Pleckstrin homology domain and Pleckstrin homology-like domain and Sec7 domain, alpha orthogonal bundle-containing protein [Strongyloides ratti]